MIIEKTEIIKRENLIGDTDGFDMSLSGDDIQWIMTLLSDLYKDPYSIIWQEWGSNAWDSHLEANKGHEPIVLSIKKDINDKWYGSIEDFGIGLGPDRIKIFGAYGKSTKRDSVDMIGAFGIGSKSIMCYTNSFYIDTCYEGTKYLYFISPNEEGIPRIDLLHEEPTDLCNRSRLWFYFKKDASSGYYSKPKTEAEKFLEGAKRKTAYFNNLIYDLDESLEDLNLYKRIEGKHFVYSEMTPFNNMHILLNQVPYEIDYQLLGIPVINVPIAIKISEGVMPTPTREAIKWSERAKEIVKEAIRLASTEVVEYCNKSRVDVTDWLTWLEIRDNAPVVNLGRHRIDIQALVQYSDVPLKPIIFTPLKDVKNVNNLGYSNLFPFYCVAKIQNGRKSDSRVDNIRYTNESKKLSITGQFKSNVNSHIGKTDNLVYVFRKKNYKLKDYKSLLMLKRGDRDTWRQQIVAYQKFVENEWLTINSYDDIVVPKVPRVKGMKTTRPKDVVNIHVLRAREKYDSTFKSAVDIHPIKDFDDKYFNRLCIYGTKEDVVDLDAIWRCVPDKSIRLFYLTENNQKYLTNHQFVHVKNWHKTKAFSRIITSYKIRRLFEQYGKLTGNYSWSGNFVDTDYSKKLKELSSTYKTLVDELSSYSKKNFNKDLKNYELNNEFMASCMELANTEKLWDYSIYYKIQLLEDMIKKFEFVEVFKDSVNWTNFAANYIKKVNKDLRLNVSYYQNSKAQDIWSNRRQEVIDYSKKNNITSKETIKIFLSE